MACLRDRIRIVPAFLVAVLALFGLASCGSKADTPREAAVKKAFETCKAGLINNQSGQAMTCVPKNVDAYLTWLKSNDKNPSPIVHAAGTESPGVDLLLKTALEKKVPDSLRPNLTFNLLLQRIAEKKLLSPRDVEAIDLGHISVEGNRASGEIYYQGTLTALRMPFILEDNAWKIDILAILPYAEILMRLDRAIKGVSQQEQVDLLVSKLPSL